VNFLLHFKQKRRFCIRTPTEIYGSRFDGEMILPEMGTTSNEFAFVAAKKSRNILTVCLGFHPCGAQDFYCLPANV
jgi:hypothetical protein